MQQLFMATHGKAPDLRLDIEALRAFRSKLRLLEREIGSPYSLWQALD